MSHGGLPTSASKPPSFPVKTFKFIDSNTGIAAGGYLDVCGVVWRTTDGGINWSSSTVGSEPYNSIAFPNSNTVVISSNVWLAFANVARVNTNTTTNVINIVSLTNSYNIVNNGVYSNTMYPLMDIVRAGDNVLVNNAIQIVQSVNYALSLIYLTTNSTSNVSNSFLSVSRTMVANANSVLIFTQNV